MGGGGGGHDPFDIFQSFFGGSPFGGTFRQNGLFRLVFTLSQQKIDGNDLWDIFLNRW